MAVSIIQILTTILTTIISLIALKKDERSRTEALKREVSFIKPILFIIAGISILNTGVSYYTAKNDKHISDSANVALNKNLDTSRAYILKISKQNTDLREALSYSLISQSKLITTSQQKSATELNAAAQKLRIILNGSSKPPLFSFVGEEEDHLLGLIQNLDSLPVYGFSARIINMKSLELCAIQRTKGSKKLSITAECFNGTNVWIDKPTELQSGSQLAEQLPKKKITGSGRYLVKINIKNKSFYEEAIYKFINGKIQQSTKIIKLNMVEHGIVKSWIAQIVPGSTLLKGVDWQKEFPEKYLLNLEISP